MGEYFIVAVITAILSALSSGFEAMFIALNIYDLSKLNVGDKKYRKLEFIVINKRIFIFIFLFLNTIWNVLFSISVFYIFLALRLPEIVSGIFSVLVVTPFLFMFSEILPKAVFRKHKEVLLLLTYPVFLPFAFLGKLIFGKSSEDTFSFTHILSVVQKEFEEGEYSLIADTLKRIARLEEITVKTAMSTIDRVGAVCMDISLREAIGKLGSEFLIVVDGMRPLGFLKVEDVLSELVRGKNCRIRQDLVRSPKSIVYEKMYLTKLLEENVDLREPVFVVNDVGVVVGVVSWENVVRVLLESICGVKDRRSVSDSFVIDGSERMFYVLELVGKDRSKVGIESSLDATSTVSSVILSKTGVLPKPGQKVRFLDLVLRVVEVSGFRISRVVVKRARER